MKTVLDIRRYPLSKLKALQDHDNRSSGRNEHCDPARKKLNVVLIGYGKSLHARALKKIQYEKVRFDKRNETPVTSFIFSASPEYFQDEDSLRRWVQATMGFILNELKQTDILRATLHRDETTPHLHVETLPTYEKKTKRGVAIWGSHQKASWGGELGYVRFLDRYAEAVKHLGIERGDAPKDADSKILKTPSSKTEYARKTLLSAEQTMKSAEEKLKEAEKKLKEASLYQASIKTSAEAIIDERIIYRPATAERPEGLQFGPNQPKHLAERQKLVELIKPAMSWAVRFAKKIYDLTGSSGGAQDGKDEPERMPTESTRDRLTQTLKAARQKARDREAEKAHPVERIEARPRQAER